MGDKNGLYKKKIIKQLYFAQILSSSDLSVQTKTSLPLTTKMLNELIEENYIVETGYAPSTGGRRPLMYSLRPDIMYVVAVDMDQLFTRIVIMDMQKKQVSDIEKIELHLAKNPQALAKLVEKIDEHIRKAGIIKERIVGIGIGMPGFVDAKKGINYSFLDPGQETLAHHIAAKTGIPTFIDNYSSVSALAEYRFEAAANKKTTMFINLRLGVILCILLI